MSSLPEGSELAVECPSAARTGAFTRAVDVLCASLGLIALSPIFCAIALAIKLDDGGSVFYWQERVGKGFRGFRLCKFRSMIPGADRDGLLTARGDSRQTRIGRLLRRCKLDELPQMLNVLKGDMQLVGARPEVHQYVQLFRPQYAILLQDRPGITDPASLLYRREDQMFSGNPIEQQYVEEILPEKLRISIAYKQRRNFLSDFGILLRTIFTLVR